MRSIHLAVVFAVAALTCSSTVVQAQSPPAGTDRVEEDWKLVIADPDPAGSGPQITTCMFPDDGKSSQFVAFNLNYRANPSFATGGVQIQTWDDGVEADSSSQGSAQCNTANEQITWTQRMSLSQGAMTYSIENGVSTTWGKFGQGNGLLNVNVNSLANSFDSYNPATSAARSGVGWQKNRVSQLTLLQVRYYSGGNLVSTDSQPRPVVDSASN